MTLLGDFDPDDRRLLAQALEAAAVLISTSSPGRKEETASEGFAMASYVLASAPDHIAHPLIMSILRRPQTTGRRTGGAFPDYAKLVAAPGARERSTEVVRSALALVDAGATPDEASAYRGWLLGIATAVAQAGKEDQGFLGRGGVMVNDAERAALAELAALLGLEAPSGLIDVGVDGRPRITDSTHTQIRRAGRSSLFAGARDRPAGPGPAGPAGSLRGEDHLGGAGRIAQGHGRPRRLDGGRRLERGQELGLLVHDRLVAGHHGRGERADRQRRAVQLVGAAVGVAAGVAADLAVGRERGGQRRAGDRRRRRPRCRCCSRSRSTRPRAGWRTPRRRRGAACRRCRRS